MDVSTGVELWGSAVADEPYGDDREEEREDEPERVAGEREREQCSCDPADGADRSEAQSQRQVADPLAMQGDRGHDSGREDDEERRRLRFVLRDADDEREERHHHDPAADAQQAGGPAGEEAERDERGVEDDPAHLNTVLT